MGQARVATHAAGAMFINQQTDRLAIGTHGEAWQHARGLVVFDHVAGDAGTVRRQERGEHERQAGGAGHCG